MFTFFFIHLFLFATFCILSLIPFSLYTFISCRCKELPEGSSCKHHSRPRWGTNTPPSPQPVRHKSLIFFCTYFFLTFFCSRSSPSQSSWFLGFCQQLWSLWRTRCVALCSVCPPSVRTEPCRYTHWHTHTHTHKKTQDELFFSLIVRPWLISQHHTCGGIHRSFRIVAHFSSSANCCQLAMMARFRVSFFFFLLFFSSSSPPRFTIRPGSSSAPWGMPWPHTLTMIASEYSP